MPDTTRQPISHHATQQFIIKEPVRAPLTMNVAVGLVGDGARDTTLFTTKGITLLLANVYICNYNTICCQTMQLL